MIYFFHHTGALLTEKSVIPSENGGMTDTAYYGAERSALTVKTIAVLKSGLSWRFTVMIKILFVCHGRNAWI